MPSRSDAADDRAAEPALFAGLIDDAAVFPPGNAPLPDAVRLHQGHLQSGYAALVGPLLVPASAAGELPGLTSAFDAPLQVGVIARPGVAPGVVAAAVAELAGCPTVAVVGVELGWTPTWRELRDDLWRASTLSAGQPSTSPVALTVEVPRGKQLVAAIADIARDAGDARPVQAKFRTGATQTWPWPDEAELATFIRSSIDHDLGFKLTGGLHHAIRGAYDLDGATSSQHGLLNVLTAVRWALNGEDVDELVPLLAQRDPVELVTDITRMSGADAALVRAFFTAYGCCQVTDPVAELSALRLIEEH